MRVTGMPLVVYVTVFPPTDEAFAEVCPAARVDDGVEMAVVDRLVKIVAEGGMVVNVVSVVADEVTADVVRTWVNVLLPPQDPAAEDEVEVDDVEGVQGVSAFARFPPCWVEALTETCPGGTQLEVV